MARYTGPVCKLCRREGEKLFLKGARCLSPKCAVEKRGYPPGQHGKEASFRRGRTSDYNAQLREKQKARRIYGVLERQFRRYFAEAVRRRGPTGTNLLQLLEMRLDNVIYRLALADSRAHARQLVGHRHFDVNGLPTNIASYNLRPGDQITVHGSSRNLRYFREIRSYMEQRPPIPDWLQMEFHGDGTFTATVLRLPERSELQLPLNEQLIVEYYSR
ncbi:MAG: 30S ribosomal protein S4 [Candidatus Thermofonsia Clade 1 bacterium]|jgi:small subunit ribosomal protein S4|uniref:Small ribosomal subunit protein uS4 n=1 Tax=Candidatus Thermofonsia Clade 1 bacterium TaxID=2364210 RepID=A0A2M8PIU1_9CHLR|nr:MAG: 30S ribosomal protein S4 [Candidatus Thermofonsia Clade 1 bacterium]PJF42647.1 MAG: 30S ribosomal protein S4 [Candidatus Thermofonsia Clade 1 bacterium]RMF53926.1 MAG: 30S ribosomal protein S4 [Chloroflexota bacterium]